MQAQLILQNTRAVMLDATAVYHRPERLSCGILNNKRDPQLLGKLAGALLT